ncbi:MAG: OmpA family protein [Planctomycetes bacterium]|nr:OmpA family protein [Planctomycetota bacterium]
MSRKRQVIKQSPAKVPGYIVTFSDMVTLLLTFFVMLLSLAQVQDPELFNKGRESFIESMRTLGLGLGMLPGRRQTPDFGQVKTKHFISTPDKALVVRTIDAKEEELRWMFKELTRSVAAMPSQIVAKTTKFSVTDIHFRPGQAVLDESAKKYLTEFCLNLRSSPATERIRLCVLGLAAEQATRQEQWLLSARRAQAVADFLNDTLPSNHQWPVYSWGAGPGGDWVTAESPISEKLHILIAVLRADE